MSHRSAAPAVVLVLAPWCAAPGFAQCVGATGPSLRIMTYNASFQAPGMDLWNDPSEPYLMSDESRVIRMRQLIELDDPDVIAFQEINKDGVKDKLADELDGTTR